MIDYQTHLAKMDETRKQISITNSKQRKYEMYRHLKKLKNEFRIAKMYEAEAKRRKG